MTAAVYRVRPASTVLTRWIMIAATAVSIGIGSSTAMVALHFRDHAIQSGTRELEQVIAPLKQHLEQTFDECERARSALAEAVKSAGISTEADFDHSVSMPHMHDVLLRQTHASALVQFTIADASGNLLYASSSRPRPDDENLKFTRMVRTAEGHPVGVFTTWLEPQAITAYLASATLDPDITISIWRGNRALLLSYAQHRGASDIAPQTPRKTLAASRPLQNSPITIEAAMPRDVALADWYAETTLLAGITGALIAIFAGALFLIIRRFTQQRTHLVSAVDNMAQGLVMFDTDQRVVICNQPYRDLYGVSTAVVRPGATLRSVIAHRKELGSIVGDVDAFCARVLQDLAIGKPFIVEMKDGRSIQILDRPMMAGGWVSTHEDITERRRLDRRIAHLAHYDVLTDLPNRALFLDRLEARMENTRLGGCFALLFIDLDEFKSINDTLGHAAGDTLLQNVAACLKSCIGDGDIAARLGGDEFAIIRDGVSSRAEVREFAESVYSAFADAEPNAHATHRTPIKASIGIAIAPRDGTTTAQLLRNADMAMYRAKAGGRTTFRFYEPVTDEHVTLQPEAKSDIRDRDGADDGPSMSTFYDRETKTTATT